MAEAAWGRGRAAGVSESLAFLTSRAPSAPLSSPVLWAPRTHTRLKGQNRIWGLFSLPMMLWPHPGPSTRRPLVLGQVLSFLCASMSSNPSTYRKRMENRTPPPRPVRREGVNARPGARAPRRPSESSRRCSSRSPASHCPEPGRGVREQDVAKQSSRLVPRGARGPASPRSLGNLRYFVTVLMRPQTRA